MTTTTNASAIARLKANQPVYRGLSDNGQWTGTYASNLNSASCNTTNTTLQQALFHSCGSSSSPHWVPNSGWGNYTSATPPMLAFNLWVRATTPVVPSYIAMWFKADSGTSCTSSGCNVTTWTPAAGIASVANK